MSKLSIDVTAEVFESLAAKVDSFSDQLSDEERALLSAVVAEGVHALAPEVEGFGSNPLPTDQISLNFMMPGSPLRGIHLSEISGLKFEVDVIEPR